MNASVCRDAHHDLCQHLRVAPSILLPRNLGPSHGCQIGARLAAEIYKLINVLLTNSWIPNSDNSRPYRRIRILDSAERKVCSGPGWTIYEHHAVQNAIVERVHDDAWHKRSPGPTSEGGPMFPT